jgi:two-component system phosphate regulon response regulator PhoB
VHRIRGLELGAEDYVVKPFSMRELLLRVRAVLRRAKPPRASSRVERGRLAIDTDAHRVWVDGEEVAMARFEMKLLGALIAGDGRVLSRENLLDTVWGPEAAVLDRTVDVTMLRLRRKLGPAAEHLEAVRGVGYRFVAPPSDGHGHAWSPRTVRPRQT